MKKNLRNRNFTSVKNHVLPADCRELTEAELFLVNGGREVENSNAGVANAQVGDTVTRNDNTTVTITQGDIDWAQAHCEGGDNSNNGGTGAGDMEAAPNSQSPSAPSSNPSAYGAQSQPGNGAGAPIGMPSDGKENIKPVSNEDNSISSMYQENQVVMNPEMSGLISEDYNDAAYGMSIKENFEACLLQKKEDFSYKVSAAKKVGLQILGLAEKKISELKVNVCGFGYKVTEFQFEGRDRLNVNLPSYEEVQNLLIGISVL